MNEASVSELNTHRPPVDLTEFNPRCRIDGRDPRRQFSAAIPMAAAITAREVTCATYEASERPMGAYVAEHAARVVGAGEMTLQIVQKNT